MGVDNMTIKYILINLIMQLSQLGLIMDGELIQDLILLTLTFSFFSISQEKKAKNVFAKGTYFHYSNDSIGKKL